MIYKIAYADVANAGDLLNIYIMEKIFGIEIENSKHRNADLVGIGSSLGEYQYSDFWLRRLKQKFQYEKPVYVWGTGFISDKFQNTPFWNKKLQFVALRGKLSKERVQRLTGKQLGDIPLCDGGILTSELFAKGAITKKYTLGIIPHYKEQDEVIFKRLLELSENSTLIDLKSDPMSVYEKIGSCEYILSSSLHGLIIADSFGIPNLHIKATNKMMGDGYKYRDYYSGYDLNDDYYDLNLGIPSISDILSRYKVRYDIVQRKKEQMKGCFPF